MNKKNKIRELSFQFSLDIVEICKYLKEKNEYVMSEQLLKSGTSIGANVTEAQAAQSKADFISKMNISLKEAWETRYWINLLHKSEYISSYKELSSMKEKLNSIINILTKIVKSSKQ